MHGVLITRVHSGGVEGADRGRASRARVQVSGTQGGGASMAMDGSQQHETPSAADEHGNQLIVMAISSVRRTQDVDAHLILAIS